MGFANPPKPVDYELIGQIVQDEGAVDYDLVRASCDLALQSTDAAITALHDLVTATQVDYVKVRDAAEEALVSTDAAISALNAIVSELQSRPAVPGWVESRIAALTDLTAIQAALDSVNAQLTRSPDATPEAAAVVADLEAQAAALWPSVK